MIEPEAVGKTRRRCRCMNQKPLSKLDEGVDEPVAEVEDEETAGEEVAGQAVNEAGATLAVHAAGQRHGHHALLVHALRTRQQQYSH